MTKAIEVSGVSVRYNVNGEPALKDVSFDIDEGEFVLLVGRTGSGKSTLLNTINGVIPHIINAQSEGSVRVYGKDPKTTPLKDLSQIIGTVYQTPEDQIFSLIVEDDVAFGPENLALPSDEIRKRVDDAIGLVNLQGKKRFPTFLLSGGQKQRLVIADALAMRPKIMILDEPTSMLDSLGTSEVFSTLKKLRDEYGMTIIMAEHKVERVLGLVDRLILIHDRTVAIDKPIRQALMEDLNSYGIEEPQISFLYKKIDPGASMAPITVDEFLEKEAGFASFASGRHLQVEDALPPSGDPVVEFKDVSFMYEKSKNYVLEKMNFVIKKGEYVSVVGPNGSGKTTALRLIAGLQKPTLGDVRLMGISVSKIKRLDYSSLVGYVFQDPDQMLFNSTVLAEVEFTLRLRGMGKKEADKIAEGVLDLFSLRSYRDENPHRLSVGQRRLLSLAAVLVNKPKILLLDEPTRGLDWRTGEEVLDFVGQLVREQGETVITVSHNMKQASDHSSRMIVFYNGSVVADGDPRSVFSLSLEHPEWSLVPPQVFQLSARVKTEPAAIKVDEIEPLLQEYRSYSGHRTPRCPS
ncbi:MAG: ABC transporter ATP-binding protein [Thermoprotei archaeon]|nr:energy-coupling factor transporter ATPase [TACK group archaeon]